MCALWNGIQNTMVNKYDTHPSSCWCLFITLYTTTFISNSLRSSRFRLKCWNLNTIQYESKKKNQIQFENMIYLYLYWQPWFWSKWVFHQLTSLEILYWGYVPVWSSPTHYSPVLNVLDKDRCILYPNQDHWK
jgi:hypothetical protein